MSSERYIYTLAPSFGGAKTTTIYFSTEVLRLTGETITRRQRVDLIEARLNANNIQRVSSVSSAPAFGVPRPPVIHDTSAATEKSPTISADPKPKLGGRPGARQKDFPKIDKKLHRKNGTRVKKMKERSPEKNLGWMETLGMYDPNNKPDREDETSAKNGNERPINGPGFAVGGDLTADVEIIEIAELQVIELGLAEERHQDNHIYRNANLAPLREQTGRMRVGGYAEEPEIVELTQDLRIDELFIQQRFESHFEPLTPTPSP